MGVMADPSELVAALRSLGVVDRMPTGSDRWRRSSGPGGGRCGASSALNIWPARSRCECSWRPVPQLMPAMATIPITLTGREFYGGAGAADDAARIGVLLALTRRLADQVMLPTARLRRGDADDGMSPLVMPSLHVAEALQGPLTAAAHETQGSKAHPRSQPLGSDRTTARCRRCA